jgi:choline kinase/mannose-6-phosphate isomerase-like protein (cupin superfamily)/thiamine kinase-like enzyme|tara:strand:+ start:260 stop:2173 length:1914 start_codon:yes stop_codon:yes gene_type:complete
MKTIYKPWGREEWLELNDKYCYKRIYINAGTKTSYQYHENKLETNYLIEGTAEFWLENDEGVVEKTIEKPGFFVTIKPFKKHRVVAVTDIILQEVSTPEVDDVIRISDDSDREDGKITHEHMKPALCILTAGIGSRLENLSEHINKGLLPLDNKAIITHMIDKIPKDYEIVVALGYRGDMVREYCLAAHTDRTFKFVEVDKYDGEGTGPSYSINQCKEYLQRPFIWVTADTIVSDELPRLNTNWLGVYPTGIPELYATINVDGDNAINLKNKNKQGYDDAFIGLASVYDYETFWNELDVDSGEIVSAYYNLNKYSSMKVKRFDWYDVGTIDNYIKAKNLFKGSTVYSIPKVNGEFLYKVNDKFIKLSSNKDFIKGRIKRSAELSGLVPKINFNGKNLYSYNWQAGKTLYECDDTNVWNKFLNFCNKDLWKETDIDNNFLDTCEEFYYNKSMSRLKLFFDDRDDTFTKSHTVNNVKTDNVHNLLKKLDWQSIFNGIPTKLFHGDLQFDNVIIGDNKKFYLLDWRQDFGGSNVGDVYYDLAKMYGGILMSYKLMANSNNFTCFVDKNVVSYTYKSEPALNTFMPTYEDWIVQNGYDLNKVKTITSLIFLNMAPLHEKEFGDLLFFKSKQMLQELINNDK